VIRGRVQDLDLGGGLASPHAVPDRLFHPVGHYLRQFAQRESLWSTASYHYED
jgi:hypothetical protein